MRPVHRVVFKSWGEFVDTAENGKTDYPTSRRVSLQPDEHFTGVKSPAEAYKLAREGWTSGAATIKDMAAPVFNHISKMIERVEVNHDVEGHSIDVARFVDGEPEAWLKFENVIQESETGHKLVRIAYNISASAGISKEVITRKGAAAAALVELLEYAGHRVELILCEGGEGCYGVIDTEMFIRMKEFDQNLDMPVLAFALAHPATLRCLMFSIMEQYPAEVRRSIDVGAGYGRPKDIEKENQGDIYIGKSRMDEQQWHSEEAAEAWVIDQLKKQGISLNMAVK